MKALLAAVLLAASSAALAAPTAASAQKVAAISLLGDKLLVVDSQMQTGSRIDRNKRDYLALKTNELDTATVLAFEREAKRARPQAEVVLLRANDPAIYALQEEVVAGKRDQRELLAAIAPLARRSGATHLVLMVKSRGESKIELENGVIGTGFIEGLGFYVDRWPRVRKTDVGDVDMGVLAPFAYFKAVLVELDGLKVITEESTHFGRALYPKDVATRKDPWDYLTVTEKVQALNTLSDEGLQRVVPKVMGRL